jgi:hypothetical protein
MGDPGKEKAVEDAPVLLYCVLGIYATDKGCDFTHLALFEGTGSLAFLAFGRVCGAGPLAIPASVSTMADWIADVLGESQAQFRFVARAAKMLRNFLWKRIALPAVPSLLHKSRRIMD